MRQMHIRLFNIQVGLQMRCYKWHCFYELAVETHDSAITNYHTHDSQARDDKNNATGCISY